MTKQSVPGLLLLALVMAMSSAAAEKATTTKVLAKATHAPTKAVAPVLHETLAPIVLSSEQLVVADKVLVGKINCELAVVVTVTLDAQSPGRFFLETGRSRFAMLPVVTSTGAVRLEEESSGAVWLQLGNKSMLMNQKEGKRIADDCMNPDQLLVAQAMARNPVPSLLDAPKDALVPVGSGGVVQELVPNPAPKPSTKAKVKVLAKSK